jgi:hypothetical protein
LCSSRFDGLNDQIHYQEEESMNAMKVLVFTDSHITGSEELSRRVTNVVDDVLDRFRDRITRVEVYLSDENSRQKGGGDDKRCVMEARLAGLQPITVRHLATSGMQAVEGASAKLANTLQRTVRRSENLRGRVSMAGEPAHAES